MLATAGCDAPEQPTGTNDEPVAARPNVLLIVLDTTRRDRLGCYGYEKETTPALDRLAAEGVVYDNAITAGSWTLPAHASLFTGMFPRDHRCTIEYMRLDPHHTTLSDVLRGAGYRTAGFSSNPWVGARSGLQRGFAEFFAVWRDVEEDERDEHGAAMVTERALQWIDAAPSDDPFFLFLNYLEPHLPYNPPASHRDRFLPEGTDPAQVEALCADG